jgi:xanthine dehydrogenase accessory factor
VTDETLSAITGIVNADRRGASVTVIAGLQAGTAGVVDQSGSVVAGALPTGIEDDVRQDALLLMGREKSQTLGYGESQVFFDVLVPRPTLFVFGAVHIAQELVQHAALLGFHTIVADPRPAFVTEERFPEAELRVGWPGDVSSTEEFDDRTFVVVLTHDRRFEDPLWPVLLPSGARYIGAMGSAKTTARRAERLLNEGFDQADIDRIHGPVGLDIGSRTAGETAVAILGEMIASRYLHDETTDLGGVVVRA